MCCDSIPTLTLLDRLWDQSANPCGGNVGDTILTHVYLPYFPVVAMFVIRFICYRNCTFLLLLISLYHSPSYLVHFGHPQTAGKEPQSPATGTRLEETTPASSELASPARENTRQKDAI